MENIRELIRNPTWSHEEDLHEQQYLTREWLVTNGLGGYASGTVAGVATRRYHGLLIAALPAPLGRVIMFAHLSEQLRLENGTLARLSGMRQAPSFSTRVGLLTREDESSGT